VGLGGGWGVGGTAPVVEAERVGGGFGADGGVRTGRWCREIGPAGRKWRTRSDRGGGAAGASRPGTGRRSVGDKGSGAALRGGGANRPWSLGGMESAAAELPGREAPAAPDPARARTRVDAPPHLGMTPSSSLTLDVRRASAIRSPAVDEERPELGTKRKWSAKPPPAEGASATNSQRCTATVSGSEIGWPPSGGRAGELCEAVPLLPRPPLLRGRRRRRADEGDIAEPPGPAAAALPTPPASPPTWAENRAKQEARFVCFSLLERWAVPR
jgi:hypothetical protein